MTTTRDTVQHGINYMEGSLLRDGLQDILTREEEPARRLVQGWARAGVGQLYLVGCGGSFAIMEPAKWLLDRYTPLPVDRYTGWEFVRRAPQRLDSRAAVVLASHSGTTEEVLEGMALATARGASTAGFSKADTPLSAGVQTSFTYHTPAVNLAKLLLTYMVTAECMVQFGDAETGRRLWSLLQTLPQTLHEAKEAVHDRSRALAAEQRDNPHYYILGTGLLAGLAYQFAVCSLLEMQWLDASALNAAEFRHGPLEIVREGLPMIVLLGRDESRPEAERALHFAQRYGARTLVFDLADMPGVDPLLAHFGVHLQLQWFNWYLGVERGHPISTRRYMGIVPY